MTQQGDPAIQSRFDFAFYAAKEVEKLLLDFFQRSNMRISRKEDGSLVTDADKDAESRLRELLNSKFPDDSVVGEEFEKKEGNSKFCWILDPIDGTQSFVCGVPLFGTLIGLLRDNQPCLGIVNMPALNEYYYAQMGLGAWWKPTNATTPIRAKVSEIGDFEEAMFCATTVSKFQEPRHQNIFEQVMRRSGKFRGWGDCYGHMLVATGRAEVMVDFQSHIWDCAAIYPIVVEAGGSFFDQFGTPRVDGGSAISVNEKLKSEITQLLK